MKPVYIKAFVLFSAILTVAQSRALTQEEITINRNGIHLEGKFYISENTGIFPTVILLQGFPGNETDVLGIGMKLSEVDYNALTFNYSGTYHSESEFNFTNAQKDIKAAFNFLDLPENITKYKIDTTHIILGGYSFGGGMALTYAANHPEIKEVFSIAGNDHGAAIKEYMNNPERKKMLDDIFDNLKHRPDIVRFGPGGTPKEILEMNILESNPTYDLRYCAPLLADKNILLIGGWDDQNVSIEDKILPLYRALMGAEAKNVKICAVQDDHSFRNSREEIAQIIIDWLKLMDKDEK
jgi:dipeptidyl aminopeptidase/acylaminoacyl peptidase